MTAASSSERCPAIPASPWRRIAAYLVDYFAFIIPLLGTLGLVGWALWSFGITPSLDNPFVSQGLVILALSLPVVLYFAVSEASRWQATAGKRLLKLTVVDTSGGRATFKQTACRAVVKFLPWEFFHTIYWHWEGFPLNPAPPTTFQIVAMAFGWVVTFWFIISLFVHSHRTPYDWVAGTLVIATPKLPASESP